MVGVGRLRRSACLPSTSASIPPATPPSLPLLYFQFETCPRHCFVSYSTRTWLHFESSALCQFVLNYLSDLCVLFPKPYLKLLTHLAKITTQADWQTDKTTNYGKNLKDNRSLTPVPCHHSPPSVSQFYPRCRDHIMIFLLFFLYTF